MLRSVTERGRWGGGNGGVGKHLDNLSKPKHVEPTWQEKVKREKELEEKVSLKHRQVRRAAGTASCLMPVRMR